METIRLNNGVEMPALGHEESGIVWDWRFTFWDHWGEHAVDALRVLHLRIAEHAGPTGALIGA